MPSSLLPARTEAQLVDQVLPDGIRRRWGKHLARESSEHTRRAYLRAVDGFARWLVDRAAADRRPPPSLAEVKKADLLDWRESLRHRFAVSSVNLKLAAVRSFYAWAIEQGTEIPNPASGIRGKGKRASSPHKRDALSDQEVVKVLATCDMTEPAGARDHAILTLMAYCAVRTIEIQRLETGDVETRDGRQILWVWGKGRSEPDEFVVLPAPAEVALLDWLSQHPTRTGPLFCCVGRRHHGQRLQLRTLRGMIKARYRRAGIRSPRKSAHSLRHSAITNAIRHGASPLQVQHMARHQDIKTTIGYFHETDRISDPAEDRIFYSPEGKERGDED